MGPKDEVTAVSDALFGDRVCLLLVVFWTTVG